MSWGPTIFATVIAFGSGYAVIAWFMKFISTKSFMPFMYYRVALGLVIIALVLMGRDEQGWTIGQTLVALLLSAVPGGGFYVERKMMTVPARP